MCWRDEYRTSYTEDSPPLVELVCGAAQGGGGGERSGFVEAYSRLSDGGEGGGACRKISR